MSETSWSGEVNLNRRKEVCELLGDRAKREARKQNRRLCCVSLVVVAVILLLLGVVLGVTLGTSAIRGRLPSDPDERARVLLVKYPLIDGHNNLADQIRAGFFNRLELVELRKNLSGVYNPKWQTDIPRLQAGHLGGQFWSAVITCESQFKDATRTFMDQVDVIRRVIDKYPDIFSYATSADDIDTAYSKGKIASLIGLDGGHAIDSSLGTLRQFYNLGARYMTLTHTCGTPWSHSTYDSSASGLTEFGRSVVKEMNRLGMMVDISNANNYTMMDALNASEAPVIFSHSAALAVCGYPENVPDYVLERLPGNGGIFMITFAGSYVSCNYNATVKDVADNIDHVKKVAGVDHIGIGADYDGTDDMPVGLEDVSKYPNLFAELIRRNYSDDDIEKIARKNLLRVLRAVEKARDDLQKVKIPSDELIDPQPNEECRPDF